MSSSPETTRKLVYSILQFLNASLSDGTLREDDREGVEVAVQCIGAAFDVDPASPSSASLAVPTPLPEIFASHLSSKPTPAPAPAPAPTSYSSQPDPSDLARAEKLKSEGNAHMTAKRFQEAIDSYTQAIELAPSNPVYFSNRAAAYTSLGDHPSAASDAERAIECDPSFVKAYSRLGHARYSLKQYAKAKEAFAKGLELDRGNANLKVGLENADQRIPEEIAEDVPPEPEPAAPAAPTAGGGFDFARAAQALGGLGRGAGGGAGAGGGMPDLASLMGNPQIMNMAQQMMQDGRLEQLMQNPMMQNLARQFMGPGGRGAGGGPPAGSV